MGRIYTEVLGNLRTPEWAERLEKCTMDHLDLDRCMAQRSRFVAKTRAGHMIAVALHRRVGLREGDVIDYDPLRHSALVVHLLPGEVLVVALAEGADRDEALFALGHAIGNQHWPALMRKGEIFIPLVADRKVMQAALESHRIEGLRFQFRDGEEVIPHLSPSEIRILFGGAEPQPNHHDHHC